MILFRITALPFLLFCTRKENGAFFDKFIIIFYKPIDNSNSGDKITLIKNMLMDDFLAIVF